MKRTSSGMCTCIWLLWLVRGWAVWSADGSVPVSDGRRRRGRLAALAALAAAVPRPPPAPGALKIVAAVTHQSRTRLPPVFVVSVILQSFVNLAMLLTRSPGPCLALPLTRPNLL